MSLVITDFKGNDLRAQPPVNRSVIATAATNGGLVAIQCYVDEKGPMLFDFIRATLAWNDGTPPVVYTGSRQLLTIDTARVLAPGNYVIRLDASNYGAPAAEVLSVNFSISVLPPTQTPVVTPTLYGPILPKDSGYPNAEQWDWNSGADLAILASSVKMLLLTEKGERVMLPSYGTSIRKLLFTVQGTGQQGLIQQEIISAVTQWEPRVNVQSVKVEQTGDRDVTVTATFVSKLNQKTFNIPVVYTQ